jgi:hypothetical protein
VLADRRELVPEAADRDPVVDGLHVLIQGHLDPRRAIIRIRSSNVLELSPVPQLTEPPRKTTTGLLVVAQDDHPGRVRIRALQADLLDPHAVVVVGTEASPAAELALELLLQASLEGPRIRRRLGHLGPRPRLNVHARMVRALKGDSRMRLRGELATIESDVPPARVSFPAESDSHGRLSLMIVSMGDTSG